MYWLVWLAVISAVLAGLWALASCHRAKKRNLVEAIEAKYPGYKVLAGPCNSIAELEEKARIAVCQRVMQSSAKRVVFTKYESVVHEGKYFAITEQDTKKPDD